MAQDDDVGERIRRATTAAPFTTGFQTLCYLTSTVFALMFFAGVYRIIAGEQPTRDLGTLLAYSERFAYLLLASLIAFWLGVSDPRNPRRRG